MSDSFVGAALELAARSSLVVLAGATVAAVLRTSSAAARHRVWTGTALALMALPALTAARVRLDLPLLPSRITVAMPVTVAVTGEPAPTVTFSTPSARATSLATAAEQPTHHADPFFSTVVLVWLSGFVLVTLRLLVGIHQARRIARRATPWRRQGSTRVLLTDEVRAPVTWGFRRPVILLPRAAPGWPEDERGRALLHELAHVERRDWPARLLARLACGLHWFNPLVWWMERRALLEAERAADDRVLLAGGDSHSYASQLIRLASDLRRPDLALGVPLARKKHLTHRIQAILDPGQRRTNMKRSKRLSVAAVLFLVLAGLSTIRLTAADRRDDPSRALIAAAASGDLFDVQLLLDSGADPNAWVAGDESALYHAIRAGNADVVRELLARGADFDAEWGGDGNPLIVATRAGDPEVVGVLLGAGADVDRGVAGDGNALIAAARRRDLDLTLQLIAAGADVNAAVEGEGNPLIAAAGAGELEIVRVLVEAGARIDQVVPVDENALIQAAGAGHLRVVRYLVEQGADVDIQVRDPYRDEIRTALNQAERGGRKDVTDYLRSVGARE